MTMSVSCTPPYRQDRIQEPVARYVVDWVSAADGTASADMGHVYNGRLGTVVFVPSATAAPTALYDVTITDDFGLDILGGGGADRSASANERVSPAAIEYHGNLTLNVTNAGNTKAGKVYIFFR